MRFSRVTPTSRLGFIAEVSQIAGGGTCLVIRVVSVRVIVVEKKHTCDRRLWRVLNQARRQTSVQCAKLQQRDNAECCNNISFG